MHNLIAYIQARWLLGTPRDSAKGHFDTEFKASRNIVIFEQDKGQKRGWKLARTPYENIWMHPRLFYQEARLLWDQESLQLFSTDRTQIPHTYLLEKIMYNGAGLMMMKILACVKRIE